jgi:hypothetical protein
MQLFTFRQQRREYPARMSRELRPTLEGFEARLLMSGATISGTALRDITGNGFSTNDVALPGVTVNLYQKGRSTVFESTKSASNGTFSFTNLPAGDYSLQQAVPSGYVPTGALQGYSVALKSGQAVTSQNFDDFKLLPQASLSDLSFIVTTPGGKSKEVSTLHGNVEQGDTVKAKFDLNTAEEITLVAYKAPNGDFDTSNLQQQVIFSQASTSGASGTESLTVTVPDGYFQIDFVAGPAIDHLETNPNVTYHAQSRFIDGQHGGSQSAVVSKAETSDASVAPAAASLSKMSKMVTSAAVAPLSKMSKMVTSADDVVADPSDTFARKH